MHPKIITPRVRLIIIKQDKILLSYVKSENFYFFIGGQIEYGETVKQAAQREIKEEAKANFEFKKSSLCARLPQAPRQPPQPGAVHLRRY